MRLDWANHDPERVVVYPSFGDAPDMSCARLLSAEETRIFSAVMNEIANGLPDAQWPAARQAVLRAFHRAR